MKPVITKTFNCGCVVRFSKIDSRKCWKHGQFITAPKQKRVKVHKGTKFFGINTSPKKADHE